MAGDINVVIVSAHCSKFRSQMGIRLEEISSNQWLADWAFRIKESSARREGYDKTRVSGVFKFSDEFPGCPYCEAKSFVLCSCDALMCNEIGSRVFKCPRCGVSGSVGDEPVTRLSAGHDS